MDAIGWYEHAEAPELQSLEVSPFLAVWARRRARLGTWTPPEPERITAPGSVPSATSSDANVCRSDQLGHTGPTFTLRVYRHGMRRDAEAKDRLRELVGYEPELKRQRKGSRRVRRVAR